MEYFRFDWQRIKNNGGNKNRVYYCMRKGKKVLKFLKELKMNKFCILIIFQISLKIQYYVIRQFVYKL